MPLRNHGCIPILAIELFAIENAHLRSATQTSSFSTMFFVVVVVVVVVDDDVVKM